MPLSARDGTNSYGSWMRRTMCALPLRQSSLKSPGNSSNAMAPMTELLESGKNAQRTLLQAARVQAYRYCHGAHFLGPSHIRCSLPRRLQERYDPRTVHGRPNFRPRQLCHSPVLGRTSSALGVSALQLRDCRCLGRSSVDHRVRCSILQLFLDARFTRSRCKPQNAGSELGRMDGKSRRQQRG